MSYYKDREIKNRNKIKELLSKLPDYITKYIFSIQNNTTTLSQIGYLIDISSFLTYLAEQGGDKDIKNITIERLSSCNRDFFYGYLDYLRQYEKNGIVYTNDISSLKRKLSSLRGLWAYLYNEDLIKENVLTKINIPKLRKKEIIRLDETEKQNFVDFVENGVDKCRRKEIYHQKQKVRDLAIVTLLLSTGIRVSELVGINLEDLDMDRASVKVTRKGNKADIVFFSDEAREYLSAYLGERKNNKKIDKDEKALFISSRNKRFTVRAIEYIVKGYAKNITLKKITPHKLRATYGSELYEITGDIYLVAQSLGHNSVDTTSKSYISTTDKKKAENRNNIKLKAKE